MKDFEQAKKWIERESAAGSELARAYLAFVSGAPEPVQEYWLSFFWKDMEENLKSRRLRDGNS